MPLKPARESIFRNKLSAFLVFLLLFFIVGIFVPLKVHALLLCGELTKNFVCNNGPNNNDSNGCGTACGCGQPWSKNRIGPEVSGDYCKPLGGLPWYYIKIDDICSTGDKCISGEKGLRAGSCNCSYGGLYKTCCSGSTPVNCNNYSVQDNRYPPEGTCAPNTYVYGTSCPSTPGPTSGPEPTSGPGPTSGPKPTSPPSGPTPTPGPTSPSGPASCNPVGQACSPAGAWSTSQSSKHYGFGPNMMIYSQSPPGEA